MLYRFRLPITSVLLAAVTLACDARDPLAPDLTPSSDELVASSHASDSSLRVGVSALEVERLSGQRPYVVANGLTDGARAYIDRTYVYQQVPALVQGMTYIRTAQGEQRSTGNDQLLKFRIDRAAVVYMAYHGDSPPAWVRRRGFVDTGETLVIAKDRQRGEHALYARSYEAGEVVLGSNRSGSGASDSEMYTVILRPQDGSHERFSSLSAGFYHTCGLTPDGSAYCWGDGEDGRLGDGTERRRMAPVEVLGGLSFRTVSAGGYHSCGVTPAGSAYCWGDNQHGQLGDGSSNDSRAPVQVAGGITFESVSAGGSFSCGVSTEGVVYCWGRNNRGQLGTGESTARSLEPVPVQGPRSFASVSTSWEHACGVLDDGSALCWGKNDYGQVGDGTTRHASAPVRVAGGITFASVSAAGVGTGPAGAGQNHTCGVATDGNVYCWGDNWHNPLGQDDTRGVRSRPQAVRGTPSLTSVATGGDHSCGLTESGEAWCWGDNTRGQLGVSTQTRYSPARQVSGEHAFTSLTLGWDHTCGVTTTGESYCWGWNRRGQLGDGTTRTRRGPVAIAPA